MEDLVRASDMTDAMRTIRSLSDQLTTLHSQLGQWQITVTTEVDIKTLDLKVTVNKPNGHGFIKTFTKEDVLYYQQDPAALVSYMVDLIFDQLFRQQITNTITADMTISVQNISKMARM